MQKDENTLLELVQDLNPEQQSRLELYWNHRIINDPANLYFAAQAAVPAILTADLLYKLRLNFTKDEQGRASGISYYAVSDLLQSSICTHIGNRTYVMYTPIRQALKQWLVQQAEFGPARRKKLAQFSLHYLDACPREIIRPNLQQTLRWDAQTITDTAAAGAALLEAVTRALQQRETDQHTEHMIRTAEQNLTTVKGGGTDQGTAQMAFAVNLYQGNRAYREENFEEALQYFSQIYPKLKGISDGGEKTVKIPIPEEILRMLKLETPPTNSETGQEEYLQIFSCYFLLGYGVEAEEVADHFKIDLEGKDSKLPFGQLFLNRESSGMEYAVKLNLFFIKHLETPLLLDHLLFTEESLYGLVINPENAKDDGPALEVRNMVTRIFQRLSNPKLHLWTIGDTDTASYFRFRKSVSDEFSIPFFQLGPDLREQILSSLAYLPETRHTFHQKVWQAWSQAYPPATAKGNIRILQEISHYMERQEIFLEGDLLEHLNVSGEICWDEQWTGSELLIFNKAGFFRDIFTGLSQLERENKDGRFLIETVRQAMNSPIPPNYNNEFFRLLGRAGLLFVEAQNQPTKTIAFPHLFPAMIPELQIDLNRTAYQRTVLTFVRAARHLFQHMVALLGNVKTTIQIKACSAFGVLLSTEGETVRIIEQSANTWQVIQIAATTKDEYDPQGELYDILDQATTAYAGLTLQIHKQIVPAFCTPAMVRISGGTFEMGDVMGDQEYDDETVHTVSLSSFQIGRYAVTFEEYDAFCEATSREKPGDEGWGRGRRPVINVNWYDVVAYCNWLSEQQGYRAVYTIRKENVIPDWTADGFRLPTEAEWEYAARQEGQKVRFGNGQDIADPREINFNGKQEYKKPYSVVGEYRGKTVPVGSLDAPNSLGLHDMSGNVWEWCWDWFDENYYKNAPKEDPRGPNTGSTRVRRGGSWILDPQFCRAAYRSWGPSYRYNNVGFRLARS